MGMSSDIILLHKNKLYVSIMQILMLNRSY